MREKVEHGNESIGRAICRMKIEDAKLVKALDEALDVLTRQKGDEDRARFYFAKPNEHERQ